MQKSEAINELAAALCAAQGDFPNVPKDANNPFFKSKYADLASIVDTIRPVIKKHGLSYSQLTGWDDSRNCPTITTVLLHKSGQFIESTLPMPVAKNDAQGVGSAITYGRRYGLQAIFGLAADDDDGNAASHARTQENHSQEEKPVNLKLTIESQSETDAGYFWLCRNGQPCILYVAKDSHDTDFKRLLDQAGKIVHVKAFPRGEKDGRPKYELASVVKVEAINPVTNIPQDAGVWSDFTTTMGPARFEGDYLVGICNSVAEPREKNGKQMVTVCHSLRNGAENVYANCFDVKLFPALKDCHTRFAVLKTKASKGYINIVDVMSVDGVPYQDGKILEA